MLQQIDRLEGLQRVNEFVVKFANVNGSGSASANALFVKAVLRMGITATPRNIFPSNIQGLPTWYEIRISEAGHLATRGTGVDLMVAMNPQTWDQDVKSLEPGGYLFYDNTKPMPPEKFRSDIVVVGVPLTEITNNAYTDSRQRQLFKNIVGLGALSALIEMDPAVIETLLAEQFKGRDKLIAANVQALHMGRDWARLPDRANVTTCRYRRRSHFYRRQQRSGAGCRIWRSNGLCLVSNHTVIVACRSVHALLRSNACGSGNRQK
jgi:2-oxoglutarate ferredoxin oxidoreductase subunit alpha